jgi:predicted deacylase
LGKLRRSFHEEKTTKKMGKHNSKQITELNVESFPKGQISETWLHIINNGIGEPIRIPIVIVRGKGDGPVLGLNAALHGNELNGIPVIQKLINDLNLEELNGTIVGILVANVPGLLLEQRNFNDGVDLNRISPGKSNGTQSELYIHRLFTRIVKKFDYLIDLHTASFGRVNTYYIRADMSDKMSSRMARLQNPEIILNHTPTGITLRGRAALNGIKTITIELKDPHLFQREVIIDSLEGVKNILYDLKMLPGKIISPTNDIILCESSYWLYTDEGGILYVTPQLGQYLKKGDKIAVVKTIFGKTVKEYFCPEYGVVIGKSVNPINQSGSRILHLGVNPKRIPCITKEEITQ